MKPNKSGSKQKNILLISLPFAAFAVGLLIWAALRSFGTVGHTPTPVVTPYENTDSAVSATPLPTPEITPSPTPNPDGLTAANGVTTVAWISDTQHYSEGHAEIFSRMTRFLEQERKRLNLRYVVFTGDFVQHYDAPAEWETAVSAMQNLSAIACGVLAGNHDVGGSALDFSAYGERFGEDVMRAWAGGAHYGGSYKNNLAHYDLITLGGRDFVFAYVSYAPDLDAVKYLNDVFRQYKNRIGVLCAHDYFDSDFSYSDSGALLLERVVKTNPNVYLVMCGHRYNVGHVPAAFDDDGDGTADRSVYQLMCNYQAAGQTGGEGYMQFLQFDFGAGVVRVQSYSPWTNDHRYHDTPGAQEEKYAVDPENEEYTFDMPWD